YVNNVIADVPYVIDEEFLDSYKVIELHVSCSQSSLQIDLVVVGKVSKLESNELTADPIAVPKARGIFRRIESHSDVTTPNVIERIVRNQLDISARNEKKQKKEAELIEQFRITSTL
ncbi:Ethanolamine-phosphate cytidylyltransferase, partial [Cichlidogyrus casuarinus]